jgi:hypothetical protein
MFGRCNFKVIAIANSMGSEHPIVDTSTVKDYIQKIHQKHALRTETARDSEDDSIDEVLETDISQIIKPPYFSLKLQLLKVVLMRLYFVSSCMASLEYTK